MSVLYWIEYVGITSEAIHICQAISEAALISLPISATYNTNDITIESLWAILGIDLKCMHQPSAEHLNLLSICFMPSLSL